jgi:hypothetical protein
MTSNSVRCWSCVAVAVVVPPVLEYVVMLKAYDRALDSGYVGLALGVLAILQCPVRWRWRVLGTFLYIMGMGLWLMLEGFELACGLYHSCL